MSTNLLSTKEFLMIEENKLPLRRLVDPGIALYLINVAPHVPNPVIEEEFKKHVRMISPLQTPAYTCLQKTSYYSLGRERSVNSVIIWPFVNHLNN